MRVNFRRDLTIPGLMVMAWMAWSSATALAAGRAESDVHLQFPAAIPFHGFLADLEANYQQATEEKKLLMLVLGANWCHDSRDFVDRMQEPPFEPLLAERYVTQLVNIAIYDHMRPVMEHFDVVAFYGTPTVMVIDPVSEQLLNLDTLPYWRNSSLISSQELETYFMGFSFGQVPRVNDVPAGSELELALLTIDDFEARQGERIYQAFAALAPLMKAMEAGEDVPGFMDKWNNLAQMRNNITRDLPVLRQQALELARSGQPVRLEFPDYPLFTDQ